MNPSFEAALTYRDDALAFLREPERTLSRTLRVGEPSGAFGLVEPDGLGWTLCIPDGADAEVLLGDRPLDLHSIRVEPSGERRLPLTDGLRARVQMGEFRFEVRPAAA